MVLITENLLRKRAEHNDLEISTLEEVSLHQQDIERIEHIDKWCRELRILYLQSNLIPKIESVGRLKKLEYLNLALNNVEKIENLTGCESLQKLDLTVNFVGELTSIEHLKDLVHFRELYLTGNPCAEYEGYREYVVATLPRLEMLDGNAVDRSERILAKQDYTELRNKIIRQQEEYRKKRQRQKQDAKIKEDKKKQKKEKKAGFDGRWYTDMNEGDKKTSEDCDEDSEEDPDRFAEEDKKFWEEKTEFTPESRVEVHRQLEEQKARDTKEKKEEKPARRLFTEDGRPLNVNEAKVDFSLIEDEENNQFVLDLVVFKHMDTSLIDVDVQTNYVKVVLKGKIFQLCMTEDINADSSSAKRSQITGHLLITMPKAKALLKPKKIITDKEENKENKVKQKPRKTHEKLEVDKSAHKTVDLANIVTGKAEKIVPPLGAKVKHSVKERPNSEDFVDDLDVPPLE